MMKTGIMLVLAAMVFSGCVTAQERRAKRDQDYHNVLKWRLEAIDEMKMSPEAKQALYQATRLYGPREAN